MKKAIFFLFSVIFFLIICNKILGQLKPLSNSSDQSYNGIYFSGKGDIDYLGLLDSAYMMMQPNALVENLSMLYNPEWNGFTEGPTWDAWWIQNSFGPTYAMLPFMDKAYQTFIFNSQAMWFALQGNGIRKDKNGFVGPKGALCDAATPKDVYYRQGDGKVARHDWGFGFTTAGIILQSELMLIRRDKKEIAYYLPLLESSADFVDTRRDPVNNMFLVGAAANLLAPSYAGSGKILQDSSYEKAYLAEISINYVAALVRLIELEKMMNRKNKILIYTNRLTLVKKALTNFITPEGYFVRSIDTDGTKHGVYGAKKHGYFETSPNCDAIAFRVADDEMSGKIYKNMNAIPELRPYKYIIPNYPSYDDMYENGGLFRFGEWVNGGEWATEESRMQIGYYRVGAFNDAREAFQLTLRQSLNFRLDNPLRDFGNKPYQPNLPVNCVYDCWGVPGGFMRGLFEYTYSSDGLKLYPHIPPGIKELHQNTPVYFGKKKIFIAVNGTGGINSVKVNGKLLKHFTPKSIFLPLDETAGTVYVSINMGTGNNLQELHDKSQGNDAQIISNRDENYWNIDLLRSENDTASKTPDAVLRQMKSISFFYKKMLNNKLLDTYEAKHAALVLKVVYSIYERRQLKKDNKLTPLPEKSQMAADNLYIGAANKLTKGLIDHLERCKSSSDNEQRKIYLLWVGIKI